MLHGSWAQIHHVQKEPKFTMDQSIQELSLLFISSANLIGKVERQLPDSMKQTQLLKNKASNMTLHSSYGFLILCDSRITR